MLTSSPTNAAEISCLEYGDGSKKPAIETIIKIDGEEYGSVPCVEGLLRGPIVGGDYEKVVSLFRTSHPVLRRFSLISPGGSVEEAIEIKRLFRKYMVTATAPLRLADGRFEALSPHAQHLLCIGTSDCICASACTLIWFGSPHRGGTAGLHRPHIDSPTFRSLGPGDASALYKHMFDDVRGYLEEMEVPKQMIELMVATGSAEIRWVDAVDDQVGRPPSVAEWEDASCGPFNDEDDNTISLLVNKRASTGLAQSEKFLLNALLEKRMKKNKCEATLISEHIERLAPPNLFDRFDKRKER